MAPFGYSDEDWTTARRQARAVLKGCAKRGRTISYSELAAKIAAIPFRPDSQHFATLLGDLSTREDRFGRGMLSVLVVHKGGDMTPGKGFFDLARHLGRSGDDLTIWTEEFRHVTDHWKAQG